MAEQWNIRKLARADLEMRLNLIERSMRMVDPKYLPTWKALYERVIDEIVRRDVLASRFRTDSIRPARRKGER